jgi:TRAP-type C4-dicarboxylate transport system substrate-binding protein
MNQPRKIRWLIAHYPQELFFRTARAFAKELNNLIGDELEIEILTYDDYKQKYDEIAGLEKLQNFPPSNEDFMEGVDSFWNALFDSDIEMSQIQIFRVADLHRDFLALDLPFLFEDHDHVQRVVEGPVGQQLCAKLGEKSGVTGLAFTYSGGYRVVGSHQPISTLDELSKTTIAVANPHSLGTTLENLGGKYMVSYAATWFKNDPMVEAGCGAIETTYLRFNSVNGKYVFKTNHSMFLTTVVVSNKFWNTLTERQQEAFRQAGLVASRQERQWSIQDGERFEAEAKQNGITITEMSAEDTEKLKHKAQKSWVECQKYWEDKDMVKEIVKQRLH